MHNLNAEAAKPLFVLPRVHSMLASIPRAQPMTIPTLYELQVVLEDFHWIGFHFAKLNEEEQWPCHAT